jgi:hypothetical protein
MTTGTRSVADFQDKCLDALRPVLAEGDDHPAYRGFIGAVEMVGDDGEPYIVILRSPGSLPSWRMLGLIDYVGADIRANVGRTDDDAGD